MKKKTILLILSFPLFEEHQAGGAQSFIRLIIPKLTQKGFKFIVLCTYSDKYRMFKCKNVKLHPVIKDLSTNSEWSNYLHNLKQYKKYEIHCNLIWTIDREYPLHTNKPVVLSSNAFCYPREINAIISRNINAIAVVSSFAAKATKAIRNIVSQKDDQVLIKTISPFVENKTNNRDLGDSIYKYFIHNPRNKYILFPHRPDPGKNHFVALEILKEIIKLDKSFKMLIPLPPTSLEKDILLEDLYIQEVKAKCIKMKIQKNVIFHPWIDKSDLSTYYNTGYCMLHTSNLPETFGLSVIESLFYGVPVFSTGAGALSTLVKKGAGHYIFNRHTPQMIAQAIINGVDSREIKSGSDYIKKKYSSLNSISGYINLFNLFLENT